MSARAAVPVWILLVWLAAGFASTVCGVGGGLFAVPILHFLLGVELRTAIATSLVAVMALTASGTLAELARPDSALSLPLIALLCLGSFAGARVGKRVADRLDGDWLRIAFVAVLAFVGWRVLATPSPAEGSRGLFALPLDTVHCLITVGIGWLGGFVSPLFGIGGGLVVVPALYLALPQVDFLHARAASTAMSFVTSAQLAWMYAREKKLDTASAMPLAVTALLAGVLGVFAVHRPGWADAARAWMGVLLFAVAARFLWDLRPAARRRRALRGEP